jgi:adenylate cyclase
MPLRSAINYQVKFIFTLSKSLIWVCLLASILGAHAYGQEATDVDSLYRVIKTGDDSSRVRAYLQLTSNLYRTGEIDSSRNESRRALSYIFGLRQTESDYNHSIGKLYYTTAICYYREGNMELTSSFLDTSYAYYKLANDTSLMISVIGVRGAIAEFKGDVDSAVACYQKAYDFMVLNKDTSNQILYTNNIAGVYKRKQQYEKAAEMYRKSLDIAERANILVSMGRSYKGLGDIAYYQGLYNLALENYNRSIPLYEQSGHINGLNNVLSNRALVFKAQKEYDAALKTYRQNLATSRRMGKEKGVAEDYQLIGEIHELKGDLDSAIWYFEKSLEISERIGYPRGVANARGVLARAYRARGSLDKAEQLARLAIASFRELENEYRVWSATSILADILNAKGEIQEAAKLAQQAYAKGVELGILGLQESSARIQYEIYKEQKQYRSALEKLEIAGMIQDSLLNEEIREAAIRTDLEYTYQKQSLKDSLRAAEEKFELSLAYTEEIEARKRRETWTMAIIVFVLLIAIGLYSRVRFIQRSRKRLRQEKERSDELLLNILPSEVAEELKLHGVSEARDFEQATVLFTDFKEFTQTAERLTAKELVSEINACFRIFDQIIEKHGIEKIKTIGDSYMAAGGLHKPRHSEVKDVVLAGLEMQTFMIERKKKRNAEGLAAFEMRVGINTGPVVAGIVGVKKFQYDIWGDTVNTASRMESHGEVGKVNISEATYQLVKDVDEFDFDARGKLEVKGKGEIEMYFVTKN